MAAQTLSDAERGVLWSLANVRPNRGGERIGSFGWNVYELLRKPEDLGLVNCKPLEHRDGEVLARLTERGMASYRKGVKAGVYRRILNEIAHRG